MKKAILTFGLFSLVMVLTSFTTPETDNSFNVDVYETGGTLPGGGGKKLDFETGGTLPGGGGKKLDFETGGTLPGGGGKKVDFETGGTLPGGGGKKLD